MQFWSGITLKKCNTGYSKYFSCLQFTTLISAFCSRPLWWLFNSVQLPNEQNLIHCLAEKLWCKVCAYAFSGKYSLAECVTWYPVPGMLWGLLRKLSLRLADWSWTLKCSEGHASLPTFFSSCCKDPEVLRSESSSVGFFKLFLLAQSLVIHFLSKEIFLFEGLFEDF